MPDTIKVKNGVLLARPAGGVLATSCGSGIVHCSPCITVVQNAAGAALAGGPCGQFYVCGLVDMLPTSLRFCEAWETPPGQPPTWAGNCVWVWAESVDISQWTAPGWVFNFVLIIRYCPAPCGIDVPNVENPRPAGFSGEIYCGSDYDDGDPCWWMVGDTALFASTTGSTNTLTCGQDGKLHGTLTMQGLDSGWGGGDAAGYTLTITLP